MATGSLGDSSMSLRPWELWIFAHSSQAAGTYKLEGLTVN